MGARRIGGGDQRYILSLLWRARLAVKAAPTGKLLAGGGAHLRACRLQGRSSVAKPPAAKGSRIQGRLPTCEHNARGQAACG
ncbi:hypothetical protein GW17_00010443 [Ensete ventricosum]|nr:hypothetical protein GW17_00010443 [Ensete ventricosum]